MEELFRHIFTTMEPTDTNLIMPAWLDITAILVGAAFGSLSAKEHKLDLMGSVTMGILCGLGGGLIRDIILQRGGVYMITSPIAIPLCLIATLVVFFFSGLVLKIQPILPWIDILSVVLFAASGTEKAVLYSVSIFGSVMLGTMSGVGGGMLRDMVLGEIPSIFRRGNFYALCAVVSSLNYYICVHLGVIKELSCAICAIVGVGLWWLSKKFNWMSPTAVDLTPKVLKPVKKIVKATPVVRSVANAVVNVGEDINRGFEQSLQPVVTAAKNDITGEMSKLHAAAQGGESPAPPPASGEMASTSDAPATTQTTSASNTPLMRATAANQGESEPKGKDPTPKTAMPQDAQAQALATAQTMAAQATESAQAAKAAQTIRAARAAQSSERSWRIRRKD